MEPLGDVEMAAQNLPVLSPEEQNITKGPPMERRKFFDRIFSVVSPEYLKTLQGYNRTLKQRNAALIQLRENKITNEGLESWTKRLALYATRLWDVRGEFITEFKGLHAKVSKQYDREIKTEIVYQYPGNNQEKYLEKK